MVARQAVPLTHSVSSRLSELLCYGQKERSNFHSRYPLPSSPSCKSFSYNTYGSPRKYWKQKTYSSSKLFRRNSYKKEREGVVFFLNLLLGSRTQVLSFHALAHSFTTIKNSSLLFSCDSELFAQNTRGAVSHKSRESGKFAFSPRPHNNESAAQPGIYPDSVRMGEAFGFRVSYFKFRFSLSEVPPCQKPSSSPLSALQ